MALPTPGKLTLLRLKLAEVIRGVTHAGGYLTDLAEKNVHDRFRKEVADTQKDEHFPLVMLMLDDGESERLPSMRSDEVCHFVVIALFKKKKGYDDPAIQAENFITDLARVIKMNMTLGGLAESAWVTEFTTDSGNLGDKGAAVQRVIVEYQKRAED